MTFERFDVVVVPFPFTDRSVRVRRPALILSDRSFGVETGQSLLAMITRAERSEWPGDLAITDVSSAGLTGPCVVRLKFFTLVNTLISHRLGRLVGPDMYALKRILAHHLDLAGAVDRDERQAS